MSNKIVTRTREEVYNLWLKALRSGKYRQSWGQLRWIDNDRRQHFCCLGVLTDLAVKDGGPGWNTEDGPSDCADSPSDQICGFMGLTEEEIDKLIEMNDCDGKTFEEIAHHIERKIMPGKV